MLQPGFFLFLLRIAGYLVFLISCSTGVTDKSILPSPWLTVRMM